MKILVTGSEGFIGKNLCLTLKQNQYEVIGFDRMTKTSLKESVKQADFVMHLAGINRPLSAQEFYDGNTNLTYQLIDLLKKQNRQIPLLLSSSIQAEKDNDYGKSKKQAEEHVFQYGKDTGSAVYVYRLENAFGKWCRPNYNSVVATFCYNIAHHKEIRIDNPDAEIPFVYIDDIVQAFIGSIGNAGSTDILSVRPSYRVTIGHLAALLHNFQESRKTLIIPNMADGFEKKLYAAYLSYLPEDEFCYPLVTHQDNRGSFTEFIKSEDRGQVSVNVTKPGIVKGNHWHHTKNEKFLVVKGQGVIRIRKIGETDIYTYAVNGDKLEVVDIPTGYTHNIENTGTDDMVTIMWCNECYDPEYPDTYFEEV